MYTLHGILDAGSIVLGFIISFLAWQGGRQSTTAYGNHSTKFKSASIAILFASIFDLMHTLSYSSTLLHTIPALQNNCISFYILARLIWSCSVLYAVSLSAKENGCKSTSLSYTILIIFTVLIANIVFSSESWPYFLITGYDHPLLAILSLSAAIPDVVALTILHRHYSVHTTAKLLQIAILFDILANISYSISPHTPFDLIWSVQIFKILANYYLLHSVFHLVVKCPYEQLVNLKEQLENLVSSNELLYKESEVQRNLVETALAKIGAILSSQLDLRDTLDAIIDMVADMMNSNQSIIALLGNDQANLQVVATYGINTPPPTLPLRQSLGGQAIKETKALFITDLSQRSEIFRPQMIFSNIRSIIAAPLMNDGHTIGVIEVYSNEKEAYKDHDALFLTALGNLAGAAITSAMLYEETKLHLEEEKCLSEIVQAAVSTVDTETIIIQCTAHTVTALNADVGIGLLAAAQPNKYTVTATVGYPCKLPGIDLGNYPRLASIISGCKPVTAQVDIFPPLTQSCEKMPVRHMMVLPLSVNQRILGFLLIGWKRYVRPERLKRLSFAAIIAQQIALGLEKAYLYNQVKSMALSDGLTGLANRRNFDMFLTTELRRAASLQRPLSLIMLDLDKFKNYNDTYGHLTGDKLLKQLGQILHKNVRSIDLPARYGGEEFSIILPECSSSEAVALAEKLRKEVESSSFPDNNDGFTARITASIGIATYDPLLLITPPDTERIIAIADKALYQAKQQGRNQVVAANILE